MDAGFPVGGSAEFTEVVRMRSRCAIVRMPEGILLKRVEETAARFDELLKECERAETDHDRAQVLSRARELTRVWTALMAHYELRRGERALGVGEKMSKRDRVSEGQPASNA